ncbi:MAG: carbohydrate ABC transporter permease [Candidatus Avoscillospira sp.]
MKSKPTLSRILQYVFIYTLTVIVLLPILNIFISAFKTNAEINRSQIFPSGMEIKNFVKVLKNDVFYTGMTSSIIITGGSLLMSTVLSATAAYPLSRCKGKAYTAIYFFFLSAMMIPAVSTMLPQYVMLRKMSLINTRLGLILIYGSRVSMGILLFTSFIKTIPKELDEAALIDGCGYFQAFFRIVLPSLKPVVISYIMVNIVSIWNDFLLPELFISSKAKQPITLAVYSFSNINGSDWGAIFALMALSVLPPMILFICCQKYFFKGMTAGAVKG